VGGIVRLRLFGALDVEDSAGAPVTTILVQPKRAAVLAYLAVAQPRGFHRRDTLLGLFWPELTDRRARDALNTAVHFLRRALDDGVLVGRGAEELGLDPTLFSSDVAEFDDAIRERRFEDALALYRGDLLAGFFISGAPEFEQWLDRERGRLKRNAVQAAWTLAQRDDAAGNGVAAARWAKRAVDLTPDDEAALRRLLTLLAHWQDVAGAAEAFEAFAKRLRETYDLEPSAETVALFESIRSAKFPSEAREPRVAKRSADSSAPLGDPSLRSGISPSSGISARSGIPPRGRTAVAGAIVGAALLGALGLFISNRSSASTAATTAAPGTAIAVFPFGFEGAREFAYLGEGVARLVETSVDGAGSLRAVDSRAILSLRGRDADEHRLSPDDASSLAEKLGAPLFVLGEIVEVGGRIEVRTSLYDRRRGSQPIATVDVAASANEFPTVVDSLALGILARIPNGPGDRLSGIAARTTSSIPALKAYLVGESAFRRGRYAEAIEAFRTATEQDTSFALAHYRLSNALTWRRAPPRRSPPELARQANPKCNRLSDRDRLLVSAWSLYMTGDAIGAEQRYREILTTRGDDVEAWFYLGEVLYHWGPMIGHPPVEAREAFGRVLALEPDNASALSDLVRLTAATDDRRAFDAYLERFTNLHPDSAEVVDAHWLRAVAFGTEPQLDSLSRGLVARPANDARRIVWTIAGSATDLARSSRLVRPLIEPPYGVGLRRKRGSFSGRSRSRSRGRMMRPKR
jgi:serine/threonine-protein kinase